MTAPFSICGIDHVVLRARDPDALRAFYVDVLGCAVERLVGDLIQMRAGSALIDIVSRPTEETDGRNVDHLCLTLNPFDLDGLTTWLAGKSVAIGEIATRYGAEGYDQSIYLTDPEGNGLELRAASR